MARNTGILAGSAILNLRELYRNLEYCRTHSSEKTYRAVSKSITKAIICVLVILLIFIIAVSTGWVMMLRTKNAPKVTEHGIPYTSEKGGQVGSETVFYTYDSARYEIDISDYGYDINDYEFMSKFTIYFDEDHQVIDIIPSDERDTSKNDLGIWIILGSLCVTCVVLILFAVWMRYSKSRLNPGREYVMFCKWLREKRPDETWYFGCDS